MWSWEKAFSYCCFCHKISQIPQNTELGYVLMAEERASQSYLPQTVQCPLSDSLSFHRGRMTTDSVPRAWDQNNTAWNATVALALPLHRWWMFGLVASSKFSASGEVHFSMVSVSSPPLNFLQAAPVTGMMRITGVLWAISFAGIRETWRSGLGGKWHLKISAFSIQYVLNIFQAVLNLDSISLPNHSLPCHWNTDLSSGCSVWEEHSQQSSLLISSKEPRRGTDLVFILYRAACAFPSFLEISFERADNARSILNSASED